MSMGHAREWNGITVQVVELRCDPGRAWHDLSSSQASLKVVLEQVGGHVEVRTRINQPSASSSSRAEVLNYVPAGMPVWGYSDDVLGIRSTRLFFDVTRLGSLLGEDIDPRRLDRPRLNFYDDRLAKLGRFLARECDLPEDYSSLYGDSLTMAIAIDLLRLTKRHGESTKSPQLVAWQLRRATEYMTAHLATGVRLSHLARLTGLSQAYFGRAFKASTGLSPHRWLLEARITRVQELLLEGKLPLVNIALDTGFSEQSHLTRVFRSLVGTTPRTWQRERRSPPLVR